MSHATGRRPKKPRTRIRPRIWRCGLCNAKCKTVLGPGGPCSVCRQEPSLPDVNDFTESGGERS